MCAVKVEPSAFRKPVVDTNGTALGSCEWALPVRPQSAQLQKVSETGKLTQESTCQAVGPSCLRKQPPAAGRYTVLRHAEVLAAMVCAAPGDIKPAKSCFGAPGECR